MALEAGRVINETYRVERLLGAGGMAEVYKVVHTRLPKHFALKLMKLDGGQRKEFLARFRREADILGSLNHAHIVEVNDWNQLPDGSPYLVMELLEGEDLESFLKRTGQLTPAVTLHICKQIGDALHAAHLAGVVHRDLKPGNVFLSNNGPFPNYVKVLDFGVAKIFDGENTPLTANATLMGTPAYMAPEQALGRVAEIDLRTDQFALASMAYEMLAGKPAFYREGDSVYTILERIVQGETPALPDHVPDPIKSAITRALCKNKEGRFPSMTEFLAALGATGETLLGSPSGAAMKGLTAQSTIEKLAAAPASLAGDPTLPPRSKRNPAVLYALLGGGLALLIAVIGVVALLLKK
jgi:serine/threonine protein kinase